MSSLKKIIKQAVKINIYISIKNETDVLEMNENYCCHSISFNLSCNGSYSIFLMIHPQDNVDLFFCVASRKPKSLSRYSLISIRLLIAESKFGILFTKHS